MKATLLATFGETANSELNCNIYGEFYWIASIEMIFCWLVLMFLVNWETTSGNTATNTSEAVEDDGRQSGGGNDDFSDTIVLAWWSRHLPRRNQRRWSRFVTGNHQQRNGKPLCFETVLGDRWWCLASVFGCLSVAFHDRGDSSARCCLLQMFANSKSITFHFY